MTISAREAHCLLRLVLALKFSPSFGTRLIGMSRLVGATHRSAFMGTLPECELLPRLRRLFSARTLKLNRAMSDTESNKDADMASNPAPCSRLEIEVIEHKRRYITIEVSHDDAETICRNMLEYNPTSERIEEAERLIKGASVVKSETMEDSYEVGSVEVLIHDENAKGDSSAVAD